MKIVETKTRLFLGIEFLLLCVALPTSVWMFSLSKMMFFFLWAATAYCLFQLWHGSKGQTSTRIRELWKWSEVNRKNIIAILPRFFIATAFVTAFTYFYIPEELFLLVNKRPMLLPVIATAYPLLSAFPQELIFCSFFFHRYKIFFKTQNARIIASAIVFGYAHMLYLHWIPPVFSGVAGLIFAQTYAKTRSLALVTIEHSLYGIMLFVSGLGIFFVSAHVG